MEEHIVVKLECAQTLGNNHMKQEKKLGTNLYLMVGEKLLVEATLYCTG